MSIQRYATLANQVARELRKQLQSEYSEGGKLPSEPEIALRLGVSRGTVRQAITLLEREGIVTRRQGSGTYANARLLGVHTRAETAYEIRDLIQQSGFEADIRVVRIEEIAIDDDIAERLEVAPGSAALQVDKLFMADGEPAVFIQDTVPLALVCQGYEPEELHQPIFKFLEARCNQVIIHNLAELVPVTVAGDLADMLNMAPGEALLRFDEVGYNRENAPIMFSRLYHKDCFIRFTLLRKRQP